MNRNQHIFSSRSTILLLQMTERNQWVLMFEHKGSKFFFEVAFYHSTFYILAPTFSQSTIQEKIIHAYIRKSPVKRQMHKNQNGPSEKIPTNCFKVWELRSFHGNGLFSRAESAAYANFKVPIVEEPLKQKEKSPTPYLENHFMALYKQKTLFEFTSCFETRSH